MCRVVYTCAWFAIHLNYYLQHFKLINKEHYTICVVGSCQTLGQHYKRFQAYFDPDSILMNLIFLNITFYNHVYFSGLNPLILAVNFDLPTANLP